MAMASLEPAFGRERVASDRRPVGGQQYETDDRVRFEAVDINGLELE